MPAESTPTTVASRGVLHLIPVGLGEAPINDWLPHEAQALAGQLNTYIASAEINKGQIKHTVRLYEERKIINF